MLPEILNKINLGPITILFVGVIVSLIPEIGLVFNVTVPAFKSVIYTAIGFALIGLSIAKLLMGKS